MTDPFSIAAGIVGVASLSLQLLGGCIQGFVILSTARNFEKDANVTVCMLNLQEIQLTEWARRAGLLTNEGQLDRRINSRAVEETLRTLQGLLTDTKQLKKRYGLDLRATTDGQPEQQGRSNAISVDTGISNSTRALILSRSHRTESLSPLKRFWWAVVDKGKIESLACDIQLLVRELWHLMNPWRQDDVISSTQSIAASMISLNERFDQLTFLNEALKTMRSRTSDVTSVEDLDNVATSAKMKAYRVGLEQADERAATGEDPNAPSRQRLLGGLEHLSIGKLNALHPIDRLKTMGTSTYEERVVFVEEKSIHSSLPQKSLARAKSLAALLNIDKHRSFGSLQCRGLIECRDKVFFVFNHPYPHLERHQPRSLLELFHPRDGIKPPSLTDRMRLALHLARLVRNFHRAGWLHKSLRSENVLFFPSQPAEMSVREQLAEPILTGFAFSRQDSPTEISEQPSADPKLDIYRHPSALGEPTTSFTAEMDIYSLGTILLEIAEWRTLRHLVESVVDLSAAESVPLNQIAEIRSFLISGKGKGGTSRLSERMGDTYTSACQMCFSGKTVDIGEEAEESIVDSTRPRPSLLDIIVERLSRCRV